MQHANEQHEAVIVRMAGNGLPRDVQRTGEVTSARMLDRDSGELWDLTHRSAD
ncbi:MAG TPA: hypothetical protein VHU79_05910 [Sphingomicrobium sp.]|nr:hypothetical protein [Sphingomicrobium sp.]